MSTDFSVALDCSSGASPNRSQQKEAGRLKAVSQLLPPTAALTFALHASHSKYLYKLAASMPVSERHCCS